MPLAKTEMLKLNDLLKMAALKGYGVQLNKMNTRWRVTLFGRFWGQQVSTCSESESLIEAIDNIFNKVK